MMYKGHVTAPNRAFDHLYDPLYLTADIKDIHKQNRCALTRTAPVNIYPVYENMFTDLNQCPRNIYSFQQNSLPLNVTSKGPIYTHRMRPVSVVGTDRAKYFSLPKGNTQTINLNLDPNLDGSNDITPKIKRVMATRTVGSQTVYREQSAQTKPFLPDVIVRDGCRTPEIMHYVNLYEADGVPGIYEVEIIERARKRRKCEAMLKNSLNRCDWKRGKTILEAIEWMDWLAREKDLEQCQELRLEIVQKLLDDRHKNIRANSSAKIENSLKRLEADQYQKLNNLYNDYNRSMRRIKNRTTKVQQRKDIIADYLDSTSEFYAPLARHGHHPRNRNFLKHTTSFEPRLETLHKSKISRESVICITDKRPPTHGRSTRVQEISRGFCDEKNLQKIYNSLKALRLKSNVQEEITDCLKRIRKSASTKRCNSITPSKETKPVSEQYVESQQALLASLLKKECETHTILSKTNDENAANLLDLVDSQICKIMNERQSHALYLLAELQHDRQERAIIKQKTVQDIKHQEQEEMYRMLMQAHSDSSIFYLENVLMQCFKNVSEIEARDKIRSLSSKVEKDILEVLPAIEEDSTEETKTVDSIQTMTNIMEEYLLPNVLDKLEGHIKKKQLTLNLTNPSGLIDDGPAFSPDNYLTNMRGEYCPSSKDESSVVVSPVSEDVLHDILQKIVADTSNEVDKKDLLLGIISDLYDKIENMMDDTERNSNGSGDCETP